MPNPVTQTITYGQTTFPFSKLGVTQEVIYSPNKIDQMGVAYTFTVSGWLTGSANDLNSFDAKLEQFKGSLAQPRLAFSVQYTDGTQTTTPYSFDPASPGHEQDIDWGPKPSNLQLGPFLAGRAAVYSFQMRVVVKECWSCDASTCTAFARPTGVLSITRKFDHRVDGNGQTVRTVSGEIVTTGINVNDQVDPDQFRYLADIALPMWYRRESMSFERSNDGRTLTYSIVDKEMGWSLPKPITSGHASYTVRLSAPGVNAGALTYTYILSGEFSATVNTDTQDIIDQIIQLAADKFPNGAFPLIPLEREFTEDIFGTNTIRFMISAQSGTGGDPTNPYDINTGLATFGLRPSNSDGQSQLIGLYGGDGVNLTSGVIAQKLVVYDACSARTNPNSSQILQAVTTPYNPNGGPGGEGSSGGLTNNNATAAHLASPYWEVHEEISYEVDSGIRVFYPKVAGAKPIKKRVHNPRCRIFQVGYVTRDIENISNLPKPPKPILDSTQVTVTTSYIKPQTPVPLGTDGWRRYTVHYSYSMEWINTPPTDPNNLQIGYPLDPRMDPTTATPVRITGLDTRLIEA